MEAFTAWLPDMTPIGLLLLAVLLLLTGELIPKKQHNRVVEAERQAKNDAIKRAEGAEAALLSVLGEQAASHIKIMESLRDLAEREGET